MVFLDTNVLVYAIDLRDARKQSIAAAIVERAIAPDSAFVISVQTLSEFANVALAKLKKPIDEVRAFVEAYRDIETVVPDGLVVDRALVIKRQCKIQFFDAMMLAAAERAGADTFLSEDLVDGETYCGIKVSNPFKLAS